MVIPWRRRGCVILARKANETTTASGLLLSSSPARTRKQHDGLKYDYRDAAYEYKLPTFFTLSPQPCPNNGIIRP
jgi:hypothetical protein